MDGATADDFRLRLWWIFREKVEVKLLEPREMRIERENNTNNDFWYISTGTLWLLDNSIFQSPPVR
jgi:hypothetical protein